MTVVDGALASGPPRQAWRNRLFQSAMLLCMLVAFGTLARRFPGLRLAQDGAGLDYRQNRVRYLLSLPVVLQPD